MFIASSMNTDHVWSMIIDIAMNTNHVWSMIIDLAMNIDRQWSLIHEHNYSWSMIVAMKCYWSYMISVDQWVISWSLIQKILPQLLLDFVWMHCSFRIFFTFQIEVWRCSWSCRRTFQSQLVSHCSLLAPVPVTHFYTPRYWFQFFFCEICNRPWYNLATNHWLHGRQKHSWGARPLPIPQSSPMSLTFAPKMAGLVCGGDLLPSYAPSPSSTLPRRSSMKATLRNLNSLNRWRKNLQKRRSDRDSWK